jgi:hypothetical protein
MAMLFSLIVAGWPGIAGKQQQDAEPPESGESDESLAQLDSGGITLIQLGMI